MKNQNGQKQKKEEKGQSHLRWVIRIFLLSVSLSAVLSLCSGAALEGAGVVTAACILMFFVLLGIAFDIIGVAVTAADVKPFHSMASHRAKGAKQAITLIRSAEKVRLQRRGRRHLRHRLGLDGGGDRHATAKKLRLAEHHRFHRGHGDHFRRDHRGESCGKKNCDQAKQKSRLLCGQAHGCTSHRLKRGQAN